MNLAHAIGEDRCTIYSQDISQKSSAMLRLNLILNNLVHSIPNIIQGNTILSPYHKEGEKLMKFDYIVSNPPFKLDFSEYHADLLADKNTERFFAGVANIPNKDKDKMAIYPLFIQHIMYSLREGVGRAAIKYTMFNIIKSLRDNDLDSLKTSLTNEINQIPESWNGVLGFRLHGMNRHFVKHLLSRISSYIDNLVGKDTTYVNYFHPNGRQFEIEHLWANKFEEHRDEFEQENEFKDWRNSIGALILLPHRTNQSFSSDVYEDKLEHYIKENTYAQTLHHNYYLKNPNFLNSETIKQIGFKSHPHLKKKDIEERQILVKNICEQIWATDYYK